VYGVQRRLLSLSCSAEIFNPIAHKLTHLSEIPDTFCAGFIPVPYSVILQQFTCEKQMESRLSLCFVPLKRHFMLIPVVVANVLAHW